MISVLIVISERLGGFERRLLRLLSHINRHYNRDFEIEIICIGRGDPRMTFEKHKRELDLYFENVYFIKNEVELLFYLFKARSDLFVIPIEWNWKPCLMYSLIGLFAKVKQIPILGCMVNSNIYDFIEENHPKKINLLLSKIRFNSVASWVDFFDVLYPNAAGFFEKKFPSKKVTVTPLPFTDIEKFKPSEVKTNKIVFLAARMDEIKNPIMMLEAVDIAADHLRNKNYKVYMCGFRAKLRDLVYYVKSRGLDDLVVFPGYVEPSSILCDAEVFCSIQLKDNYPSQALLEAISCGCYVIATDVGDTRRILDGSFSKLIKIDKMDLSRAIIDYISLDDKSKRILALKARNFAENNFKIEVSADYFYNLFERYRKVSFKG